MIKSKSKSEKIPTVEFVGYQSQIMLNELSENSVSIISESKNGFVKLDFIRFNESDFILEFSKAENKYENEGNLIMNSNSIYVNGLSFNIDYIDNSPEVKIVFDGLLITFLIGYSLEKITISNEFDNYDFPLPMKE